MRRHPSHETGDVLLDGCQRALCAEHIDTPIWQRVVRQPLAPQGRLRKASGTWLCLNPMATSRSFLATNRPNNLSIGCVSFSHVLGPTSFMRKRGARIGARCLSELCFRLIASQWRPAARRGPRIERTCANRLALHGNLTAQASCYCNASSLRILRWRWASLKIRYATKCDCQLASLQRSAPLP